MKISCQVSCQICRTVKSGEINPIPGIDASFCDECFAKLVKWAHRKEHERMYQIEDMRNRVYSIHAELDQMVKDRRYNHAGGVTDEAPKAQEALCECCNQKAGAKDAEIGELQKSLDAIVVEKRAMAAIIELLSLRYNLCVQVFPNGTWQIENKEQATLFVGAEPPQDLTALRSFWATKPFGGSRD